MVFQKKNHFVILNLKGSHSKMKLTIVIVFAALICIIATERKAPASEADDLHRIAIALERMQSCMCK